MFTQKTKEVKGNQPTFLTEADFSEGCQQIASHMAREEAAKREAIARHNAGRHPMDIWRDKRGANTYT